MATSSGLSRIALLNRIGMRCVFDDQARALQYARMAIQESESMNYAKGRIGGIYIQGIVHDIRGNADSSRYYFNLGYELSKQHDLKELEGNGLNNLGMMYWNLGYFDQALKYFLDALRIYEAIEMETGISKAVSNIGLIYQELKKFEEALTYNFRALKCELKREMMII